MSQNGFVTKFITSDFREILVEMGKLAG